MTDVAYHDRSPRTPRTPVDIDADFDMRTATDNGLSSLRSPVDTYIPPSARSLIQRAPDTPMLDYASSAHDDGDAHMDVDDDRKTIHASPEPFAHRPSTPPLRYTPPRSPRRLPVPAPAYARFANAHAHGRSNSMDHIDAFRPPTRPRFPGHGSGLMGRPRAYSDRRDRDRSYDRDGGRYGAPAPAAAPARPPPQVGANPVVGVFGLSIRTTERDLEDEFGRYGEVDKVVIVYDQRASLLFQTDRSRGFGFITMRSTEAAARVVDKMNGAVLHGRTLRVDFSATQKAHAPTPGEYKGQPRPVDDRYDTRGGSGGRHRDTDRYDSRDSRDSRDYRRDDKYGRDDRDRRDRYDRYDDSRDRDRDYRRRDRDADPYGGRSRRDRSPSPRRRYSRSPDRKRAYSPRHEHYNGNGHQGAAMPAPAPQGQAPYAAPPPQAYDPAAAAAAGPGTAPLSAPASAAPPAPSSY